MGDIDVNFNSVADIGVSLDEAVDIAINLPAEVAAFSAEYQVVYDSYTTKPDAATATIWDTFVRAIVASGEWALLDVLVVYAAHINSAGEALKNWKNPGTFDQTAFNAPTFTVNEGFTGANTKYIDCNWIPSINAINYLQNSASVGAYVRTDVMENGFEAAVGDGLGNEIRLATRWLATPNTYLLKINDNTNFAPANTDSRGLHILTRTAANARAIYKNKVSAGNDAQASTGLPTKTIYVLARNNNGAADFFTTRQLSMFFAGAGFTQTNVDNLTDAFETAMDALGKGVIP